MLVQIYCSHRPFLGSQLTVSNLSIPFSYWKSRTYPNESFVMKIILKNLRCQEKQEANDMGI